MLKKAQHRGESMLEYIVMGAIALAVLGVAIWTVVQAASTEGRKLGVTGSSASMVGTGAC